MQTLDGLPLEGLRVAVQLYGGEPNSAIEAYLETRHASAEFVAPYVYVDAIDDAAVRGLIAALGDGKIAAIVFTSKTQVQRLTRVASAAGQLDALNSALADTIVAAVGPVAARELDTNGIRVDVMPDEDFFMKPLVTRLTEKLGGSEELAGGG
jgi:uroporphyrinogen-III synthase